MHFVLQVVSYDHRLGIEKFRDYKSSVSGKDWAAATIPFMSNCGVGLKKARQ